MAGSEKLKEWQGKYGMAPRRDFFTIYF